MWPCRIGVVVVLACCVSTSIAAETNGTIDFVENDNRVLSETHNFFRQPICTCSIRSTWSSQNYDTSKFILISCGTCITMDVSSGTLNLTKGIDVQGSLEFPDSIQNLVIRTPFFRVQGKLKMRSTGVVGGNPRVKLLLVRDDSVSTSFVPVDTNKYACSTKSSGTPESCSAGRKPIVVAGGQLDLQGVPDGCKTWVKLHDVVKKYRLPNPNRFTILPDPSLYCNRPAYEESFEPTSETAEDWSGWDATFTLRRPTDTLLVQDRLNYGRSGPAWDIMSFRDCIIPGQKYLFSARIRLWSQNKKGQPTTCAKGNRSHCLRLNSFSRFSDGPLYQTKGTEKQSQFSMYDRWFNFNVEIMFEEADLAPDAIYHTLVISGPEALYDIEIDDVRFGLPPVSTVPNPDEVCFGNLIMNGNAKASAIDPYPNYMFGNGRLSILNGFFSVDQRKGPTDSIAHSLDAPGCIVPGGQYKVAARIRVRTSDSVKISMIMRIFFTRNGNRSPLRRVIADCSGGRNSYVSCSSNFLVEERFQESDVDEIRFTFETEGSKATFDLRDWSVELVEASTASVVVQEEGVDGCWGDGAEILITSHTTDFENSQKRTLVANPRQHSEGFIRLDLDRWVIPPVVEADGDGFAVEVALLSRNIVFEGAKDEDNPLHGGHLMIMHTPTIVQRIEGIEFENFGRQDGGELENSFIRNLGASTRAAKSLVRPFETDREMPSTYWCSNPQNTWIDNVAAGGESSGFWFELQREVRPPTSSLSSSVGMSPRYLPLKEFRGNVAHSYASHGLRSYPPGFDPSVPAVFVNFHSYKNMQSGIFFHNSQDLHLVGGSLADNEIQVDFDRMDNALIQGTRVMGTTPRYKEIISLQTGRLAHNYKIVGIQVHGFARDITLQGVKIRNVRFSGFPNAGTVPYTALIDVDDDKWTGHFDYWTTIKGVRVAGGAKDFAFDFRRAAAVGINDILLTDLDSSMKPKGSSATGISSVISNSPQMTSFINITNCHDVSKRGYLYCRNTCLETFTLAVSPSIETKNMVLFLRNRQDASRSFFYPGKYYYETLSPDDPTPDELRNTLILKRRYFAAALPAGEYDAEFRNKITNSTVWPSFVEKTMEPNECNPQMRANALEVKVPSVSQNQCSNLVRNGNMELPNAVYWLHLNAGVKRVSQGVGGSFAISTTMYISEPNVYVGQFLDTRCLEEGQQYSVHAWIKLVDPNNNAIVLCTKGRNGGCPYIQLRVRTPEDLKGHSFKEEVIFLADSPARPLSGGGWMHVHGIVTLGPVTEAGSSVALAISRGPKRLKMFVDNVSMERIPFQCQDLVFSGGFDSGTSVDWGTETRSLSPYLQIDLFNGNPALRLVSRMSSLDAISQNVRTGCLVSNERYLVSAKIRLLERDSMTRRSCDLHVRKGNRACPRIRIRAFVDIELESLKAYTVGGGTIGDRDHGETPDGWYTLTGIFLASSEDARAGRISLQIGEEAVSGVDIVVDDVSITHLPQDCSQLFLNGDASQYDTARFWRPAFSTHQAKIEIKSQGGNQFFKLSNRSSSGDGIHQKVDTRCMNAGGAWLLMAQMKLSHRSTGDGIICEPFNTRMTVACPSVRLVGYKNGEKVVDDIISMSSPQVWSASNWNKYHAEFTISEALAACDEIWIGIRSFNIDWDLIVDDLSVIPT